jgi:membrane fusion protein
MSRPPLFRVDAVSAQSDQWYGEIIMAEPITYRFLSLAAAIVAAGIVSFTIWGSYTKRVTVAGQIVPTKGLVKLYPQQPGIATVIKVTEGQRVKAGDLLFVLSSERQSSTMGNTQAAISRETRARKENLQDQLTKTDQLRELDRKALVQKINGLKSEISKLGSLIEDQRSRYELSLTDYNRYHAITDTGYVSVDQVTQKQADVIDQKSRLGSLERDLISTQRSLVDTQFQVNSLSIKYDNQVDDIKRNIASVEQDLSESEARRDLIVMATESGTATAITVHLGQAVDINKPLVAIIPDGTVFQANLYAPSRSVGFITTGNIVNLRYDAFPYQKFGQYRGRVTEVATTAMSSAELTGSNGFSTSSADTSEPLYRITVDLESQEIGAYGVTHSLQAGMLLQADLLQEKRKLYEWVLDPLYSVTKKL